MNQNFKNLHLKIKYDSDEANVLENFYIPVLQNSTSYKRIAGFFSSTSLAVAARGIVEFAKSLYTYHGIEILSTGGTAKLLADNGVPVIEVSDSTGFPEMMYGRVKT